MKNYVFLFPKSKYNFGSTIQTTKIEMKRNPITFLQLDIPVSFFTTMNSIFFIHFYFFVNVLRVQKLDFSL